MTFVRTPATPRKPFGSAPSSLVPPFPPFGLPANQESVHSYLESSTFWNPAQQGGSGDSAEDFKATPLRIWGGSVVDVLITSLVVIRLSWAAGYLEIRNFTTGNSGCVRSAAQRRRRERGAAQRGSTGSRTATKATCLRRLLLCFFFFERVAEGRCFCWRGRCCFFVLAGLAGRGPVLSLCAGGPGRKSSDRPPRAPHQWPRPRRRAGAPAATLEAGDPAATTEAPGERGRAGPRHRHHRRHGCQGDGGQHTGAAPAPATAAATPAHATAATHGRAGRPRRAAAACTGARQNRQAPDLRQQK